LYEKEKEGKVSPAGAGEVSLRTVKLKSETDRCGLPAAMIGGRVCRERVGRDECEPIRRMSEELKAMYLFF
jgi:hypothetical protein